MVPLQIHSIFTPAADLSRMSAVKMNVGDILHKCYFKVDEQGVEGAAVTHVSSDISPEPLPEVEIRLDRPFLYGVREHSTQSLLFIGYMANPTVVE